MRYHERTSREKILIKCAICCCRAAQGNQLEIVKMILESEKGEQTVAKKDKKRQRNVFHYAAAADRSQDSEILSYLMVCWETAIGRECLALNLFSVFPS